MIKDLVRETRARMEKTADALTEELRGIRTGRASPALVERVTVEYYGTMTPLNQVSTISAPEPRLLTIRPWEASMIAPIGEENVEVASCGTGCITSQATGFPTGAQCGGIMLEVPLAWSFIPSPSLR